MSSTPLCAPLPEGYQFEGYRIDHMFSRGGFSIVYMAHDASGTPVVVKEYLPMHLAQRAGRTTTVDVAAENLGKFNSGLRCFIEEARLLARIHHPNLVNVLDFAKANGTAYIVMRYERGRNLAAHLNALRRTGQVHS